MLVFEYRQMKLRAQVSEIRGSCLVGRMRHQRNVVSVTEHYAIFAVSISTHVFLMSSLYLVSQRQEVGAAIGPVLLQSGLHLLLHQPAK